MKVVLIIPAAGLGTRMQPPSSSATKKPAPSKQFTELHGTPILIRTIRKFAEFSEIKEIYIALRANEFESFRIRLQAESSELMSKVHLVMGGEHRQDSVFNAIQAVAADPDDLILVHDAVRPFVTTEVINEVIRGAQKHGAAIAGVPATDTIKQVDRTADGAVITATLPRERVVMAQTPQGFRYHILRKAFEEANADGFVGTDEASLLERSGVPVAVVMGSARNIKITTPADMELAEFFLQHEAGRKL